LKLSDSTLLRQLCYINGQWAAADSGRSFAVTNPASGEQLATVPEMGADETRRAIEAARVAQPAWRAHTAGERAKVLRRWFELLLANQEDLAQLMTAEQGKPLAEARGEIAYAASFIEWFAEEGKRIYGDIVPPHHADKRVLVTKEPIGVCAAITPWNFPAAMITRKVGPALAAGCCVVLKPAEATPLSALALAELAERAGVPAGVFNVVTGDAPAIGGELCANPTVRKLSFTGSTEVGRILMQQCAPTIKKLSLELGGNAPFIVFDDADLDAAVQGAILSKYRNAGQTCVCANRLLVQEGVYDTFVEKLGVAVAGLRVGNGVDDGVTQGPLIDAAAIAKVEELVEDAREQGCSPCCLRRQAAQPRAVTFFEPTILAQRDRKPAMLHSQAKKPVRSAGAAVPRSRTEADVIAHVQRHRVSVWLPTSMRVNLASQHVRVWPSALEYGIVGVNTGIISTEVAPFGGIKASGLGREGSKYGIEDYLEIKYVCLGGIN
jgi:succinate-semialdehyde dehydrogenase/glutarate-semialdehyde dehydrogenase